MSDAFEKNIRQNHYSAKYQRSESNSGDAFSPEFAIVSSAIKHGTS